MKTPNYPEIKLDDDLYPTEETLQFIRGFDVEKYGFKALVDFLQEIWWLDGMGFSFNEKTGRLVLCTLGWSGNEDVITALSNNLKFWYDCWRRTERGGKYTFKIPKK